MKPDQKLKQRYRNRDLYWLAAGVYFVIAIGVGWMAWMRADVLYACVAAGALIAAAVSVWKIRRVSKEMRRLAETTERLSNAVDEIPDSTRR